MFYAQLKIEHMTLVFKQAGAHSHLQCSWISVFLI
jgi:hypothetical protein